MIKKSLKDISWQVDEKEYREDNSLSYSTLAKFDREGFNGLEKLFDKAESPSLTFGSAVDSIITGGEEEFNERFMVAEFPQIPDSIIKMVKSLFSVYGLIGNYKNLNDIPDSEIIKETENQSYQLNWKPETRAKVIKEKGSTYYSLLFLSKDKSILSTETYQDVLKAVSALKESEATKFYFADNNPWDNDIERYYQLKFKHVFNNIEYKCMADLIIVDHKSKRVIPCDLKTSSHPEWEFYKSFNEWSYIIQARLYWRIIRAIMDEDEYFKDFELMDYKFIVVNRKTCTPLVWTCPYTRKKGTLKVGRFGQITWRDPFDIGKDLFYYLAFNPPVPFEINQNEENYLDDWIDKL